MNRRADGDSGFRDPDIRGPDLRESGPRRRDLRREAPLDPEEIERQNEAIRADMGETLQAISRRLSPGQLVDRALGLVKEHGGEAATNLGHTVKENPVPLLLTAIGLSWLMINQHRSSTGRSTLAYTGDSTEPGEGTREKLHQTSARIGQSARSARARVRRSAGSVRATAHSAVDRTRSAMYTARTQGRQTFDRMLEEQPLALGVMGLAVGALLGSLLPATEREDRLMGQARDRTLEKARHDVRAGAEQVGQTMKDLREGSSTTGPAPSGEQWPH